MKNLKYQREIGIYSKVDDKHVLGISIEIDINEIASLFEPKEFDECYYGVYPISEIQYEILVIKFTELLNYKFNDYDFYLECYSLDNI
jgi:hypothetical protein